MKIGFTGTRSGMSLPQKKTFKKLIENLNFEQFSHGDCVGADDDSAEIVFSLKGKDVIKIHPPINDKFRAFNKNFKGYAEPKDYLDRNRDIVDECDILIACPLENVWGYKGGTWYTVNYAKKNNKTVVVIWNTGKMEVFKNENS